MTRIALALVRPLPARSALALPAPVTLAAAAALALGLALAAYAVAARTAVFAVSEIEVAGAPPGVAADVRAAATPVLGTSLVGLDADELVGRLEALPAVRAVEYDRAFPSTLRILVEPERPLAFLRAGGAAWVVSDRGRVIRPAGPDALRRLPRISSPTAPAPRPGDLVTDRDVRLVLRALAQLPRRFPARVAAARARKGAPTLVLAGGTEVRLGGASDLRVKLEAAAAVLGSLPAAERAALAYVDVAVPDRVVVA